MYIYIYTYVCIYIYTCMHRLHIYIYIYIHTYRCRYRLTTGVQCGPMPGFTRQCSVNASAISARSRRSRKRSQFQLHARTVFKSSAGWWLVGGVSESFRGIPFSTNQFLKMKPPGLTWKQRIFMASPHPHPAVGLAHVRIILDHCDPSPTYRRSTVMYILLSSCLVAMLKHLYLVNSRMEKGDTPRCQTF